MSWIKLNTRREVVKWDEGVEVAGEIVDFTDTPFECIILKLEDGTEVLVPCGYTQLEPLKDLPKGSKVKIRSGKRVKIKGGRSVRNFDIWVDDSTVKEDDLPF